MLKPIDSDELENAVQKFKSLYNTKENVTFDLNQLKNIISNNLGNTNNYKKRFTIKIGQHIKMISTASIECFYSENKATNIHTIDNRSYLIDDTLDNLEEKLKPETFFRVSRKYVVNINAIKDIISYTNSRLKLILQSYSESEIIVSRERVRDFKNWIG